MAGTPPERAPRYFDTYAFRLGDFHLVSVLDGVLSADCATILNGPPPKEMAELLGSQGLGLTSTIEFGDDEKYWARAIAMMRHGFGGRPYGPSASIVKERQRDRSVASCASRAFDKSGLPCGRGYADGIEAEDGRRITTGNVVWLG